MDTNLLYGGGTLGELIKTALQRYPERTAFIEDEREITYAQLGEQVSRVIQALAGLGLSPGETVAQLSTNRIDAFVVSTAVYLSGLRMVSLHGMGSEDDHAYVLTDSEAKVVVIDPYYAERGRALQTRCAQIAHWLAHGDIAGMTDLGAAASGFTPRDLPVAGHAEDIVRLAYTGGTTGKSKGVMLSNRALITNTNLALAGIDWPRHPIYLCPAPISHGGGSFILPTLMRGGTVILQRGFDPVQFQDAVRKYRCNLTWMVPTMIYALLDHPRTKEIDWSCMHAFIYSAAPMVPSRVRQALNVFGPCLVQSYGQSESPNTILTLSQADHVSASDEQLASAGRPYPGVRVALLAEDGREVEEGAIGEICVRGPLVMSGYWKQPELTAAAFDGNWLHTGDMARRDSDGLYYIVDRKKDMVISGGFNVYPKEIEDVLAAHPAIAAAAVIGIPDEKWGESVTAVVKLKPGENAAAEELVKLVRDAKGPVYAPKSIRFVDQLPVTALGKIDKKALRKQFSEMAAVG